MTYKETRSRLEELVANKNALAAELSAAGTHSPPTDSLPDLTADAREVVAPKGAKKRYIVSNSAKICRGEFTERVAEYVAESDELRFALENVGILDVAELSRGRVGVLFAQNGQLKFKIISLENGTLALGNTLILREKAEIDYARLAECEGGALAVYATDGAGLADKIALTGRVSEKVWSEVWDTDQPENFCVAVLSDCLMFTATHGEAGKFSVVCCVENSTKNGLNIGNTVEMTADCDGDSYAGGWAICAVEDDFAALCYPRGDGQSLGLCVLSAADDGAGGWRAEARYFGNLTYKGALPSVGCVSVGGGRWLTAYGVSYQDKTANLAKSTVAVEEWGLTEYAACRLDFGRDDERWELPVGGVGVFSGGNGAAVSFCNGEIARCLWLGTAEGVVPAPAVPVGEDVCFCKMVPISPKRCILVTERAGNGYARLFGLAERVIPAVGRACGIALSGGGAGEEITVAEVSNEP